MHAHLCSSCGAIYKSRRIRCRCGSTSLQSFELRRGRLLTFTVVNATRPGYPRPTRLGLAEFEGGVKALAQLDDEKPEPGMPVEVVEGVLAIRDGVEIRGSRLARAR